MLGPENQGIKFWCLFANFFQGTVSGNRKVEPKVKADEDPVRTQCNDIINCFTLIL